MEEKNIYHIVLIAFITVLLSLRFWSVSQAFARNGACADEVATYCKNVQPGQGRIMKCLEEHENNLSSVCRANLAKMMKKHPCADDVIRYCSNIQPGEGRIIQCLMENENELTPQCNEMIQAQQRKRAE